MFTGIIRQIGRLRSTANSAAGRSLTIELGSLAGELAHGDSLAVNGACLTAAELTGETGRFDVVRETLERTTLGRLGAGDRVNLEPALRLGDGLDGHLVQGHVDGLARVSDLRTGGQWRITFAADKELTDQMVTKGSVAIDGVSLTLAEVADGQFAVALIPTTLADTTLARLAVGDEVNIETDLIGKYVRRYLPGAGGGGGLTMETLRQAGFA
jgi:riboflavin synthase